MRFSQSFTSDDMLLQTRYAYSGTLVQYIGYAEPQAGESDPLWLIVKFTYDSSNNVTKKTFANASKAFNLIWTERAGYSYA